jgi:membrane-anchored protein YejM (alkaline phosphatase superfamily)
MKGIFKISLTLLVSSARLNVIIVPITRIAVQYVLSTLIGYNLLYVVAMKGTLKIRRTILV